MRTANLTRKTNETEIAVAVDIDGSGKAEIATGVGFLDHMLEQLAHHSGINLSIQASGDLKVDDHHTVEDCGISIGQALAQALGDKAAINRYGTVTLPMDDALVLAALDFSGRPYLVWDVNFPDPRIGTFASELVREFFQALCVHTGLTLHVTLLTGFNSHHIVEACFKAVARAMRQAVAQDPHLEGKVPSTKGVL